MALALFTAGGLALGARPAAFLGIKGASSQTKGPAAVLPKQHLRPLFRPLSPNSFRSSEFRPSIRTAGSL